MLAISSLLEVLDTMMLPEGATSNKTIRIMVDTETMSTEVGSTNKKDIKVEILLDQQIMASKRMEDNIKENSIFKEEEIIDRVTEEAMIEMLIDEEMTEMETEGNLMFPETKPSGGNKEATLVTREEVAVSRNHRCLKWSKSISGEL